MRSTLCNSLIFIGSAILLYSCTKVDSHQLLEESSKKFYDSKSKACVPLSFTGTYYDFPEISTIYRMSAKFSMNNPSEILAGIYSGGGIVDSIRLTIHAKAQEVAFIKYGSNTDTMLVAHLDKKGSLLFVRAGNAPNENYLPTSFAYKGNRLTEMKISFFGIVTSFNYDKKGNLVRILDNAETRVDYQYHPTLKASSQVYFDEPRGFDWNTFSLMQFAGLLPQLNPTSLRTRTTVNWGDYMTHDLLIKNHQLDENKKLISYDVADPVSGYIGRNYVIGWSCNTELSPMATQ